MHCALNLGTGLDIFRLWSCKTPNLWLLGTGSAKAKSRSCATKSKMTPFWDTEISAKRCDSELWVRHAQMCFCSVLLPYSKYANYTLLKKIVAIRIWSFCDHFQVAFHAASGSKAPSLRSSKAKRRAWLHWECSLSEHHSLAGGSKSKVSVLKILKSTWDSNIPNLFGIQFVNCGCQLVCLLCE